jgi:hypothetical protein
MEQLQLDSISKILSTRGLNTLMFSDPYAKLCFVAHLASQFEKTIYVDLDTMFTAYLNAGLVHAKNSVDVYLPSEGMLAPMIKDVLASMSASSLVIFDSVNSFYSLFRTQERGTGGLNHLLSVLLMLVVRRLHPACCATAARAARGGPSHRQAEGSCSTRAQLG